MRDPVEAEGPPPLGAGRRPRARALRAPASSPSASSRRPSGRLARRAAASPPLLGPLIRSLRPALRRHAATAKEKRSDGIEAQARIPGRSAPAARRNARAPPENLNPFQFALLQFERAADFISASTPARARSSATPKRQLTVSIPVKMDNKKIKVFTGLPRPALDRARALEGRHPLPSRRHARRGQGARDVDDLEVRGRQHPVRRRQGRHHRRPEEALDGRERAPDAALHLRDLDHPRPRPRHPGARRLHDAAAHGLDHGHLLDDAGLLDARRRHRQADPARRLGRPQRGDRGRLLRRHRGGRQAHAPDAQGRDRGRPGLRQRRARTSRGSWRRPA